MHPIFDGLKKPNSKKTNGSMQCLNPITMDLGQPCLDLFSVFNGFRQLA
jgi:hypothetical protein